MSTDKNPYAPSALSSADGSGIDEYGTSSDAIKVAMPLHRAKFWLKLMGISSIVLGVLYCVTIIGALVGWLPLWIGILLNKAAGNLEEGVRINSPGAIHKAMSNLATVFTIAGVIFMIQLVILALYVVVAIVLVVGAGIGAASSSGSY